MFLSVTTSDDTKCVQLTGAYTVRDTSLTPKSTWLFNLTAAAGDGSRTITATAYPNFNANNCTGQNQSPKSVSFSLDNTGPQINPAVNPARNAAGWHRTDVTIGWVPFDGAGIGFNSPAVPTTDFQQVNTAGTTKTSTGVDRLGNVGNGSVVIKLDKDAPTITAAKSPAANGFGWNNTNVTVNFSCSDNPADIGSGIAFCSAPQVVTGGGSNQSVSGTATDVAGNSATTVAGAINIDKTAPLLNGVPATPPNAAGWYNGNVTIVWAASDALSGVASVPANSLIAGEGVGMVHVASVADNAGNVTSAASSPSVKIDRTAPNTAATAPSNWNNVDVTVSLVPNDALSGVAATYYKVDGGPQQAGTTVSISTEGVHLLEFWSVDNAGNVEPTQPVEVKIDKTPPTINHTQAPPANSSGWNNSDVTVTFVCADGPAAVASGIASCTGPQTVTSEGQNQVVIGTAVDNAGNSAEDPAQVSIDRTAPTIAGVADRPANAAGWYNADVTVLFTCGDAQSGIDSCTPAQTLGEGASQAVAGTAVDAAGNSAGTTVGGLNVDKTAPNLLGAVVTAPSGPGWYNGDVTVQWTCSDALSGVTACPADSIVNGEGLDLSTSAFVVDVAGNSTSATLTDIQIDRTAPATTASVPAPLPSGWHAGPVEVTLAVLDNLSGVNQTFYSVDGGSGQPYTAPFSVSGGGAHSVRFYSIDNAGNVEDVSQPGHEITFEIDDVPPLLSGSRTPGANAQGWNNTPVTVNFTCVDVESGIAGCSSPVTLSGEGAGQSVTGQAADVAGNTAATTVDNINIDLTAPTTTDDVSSLWKNLDVLVNLAAFDALSGVAATHYALDSVAATGSTLTVADEGEHSLQYYSVDNAGNVETIKTAPAIRIDKTAPTIAGSKAPAANANGWHNSDVTVSFACDDGLSGVAICSPSQTVTADGTPSIAGAATDNAGNSADALVSVQLDKTAPTIAGSKSPAANANGWHNSDVTVSFTCQDALSGIETCTAPQSLGEGDNQAAVGTAGDRAGNGAAVTVAPIRVDKTAPSITWVGGPAANGVYYFGSVPAAPGCIAADALSGAIGCTLVGGYSTAVGTHTLQVSAADVAGNQATEQRRYTVKAWTSNGFYQPVDMSSGTATVWNTIKGGSTVPLKFEVFAGATELTSTSVIVQPLKAVITACAGTTTDEIELVATGATSLRYDTSGGQFIFNWQTPKVAGSCYKVTVSTTDGGSISAFFKTR